MNQSFLTTFSLISIKYYQNQQQFYLTNKSFVRDEVFLTSNMNAKDFENSLFYVETDSTTNQFKSSIEYGQKVVFRHKISNKYLSHSDQCEEEENDTTYKLKLSHHKHQFKILPCFQYQTKISNKIRFNQDVHLVTEISGAKAGYLSTRKTKYPYIRNTILGINQHNSIENSKFSFNYYYEREKQEQYYTFGTIVWISHIENSAFLAAKTIKNKQQIIFQSFEYDKEIQSIDGLWLIQNDNFTLGGKLQFEDKFRLKNLATGCYLTFSSNFKMNENERIYNMILEQVPTEKSQFVFKSLKGQDNNIEKNSYLIFRHYESKLYIGCRKNIYIPDTQILKPTSYFEFSDEDLYKIIELGDNEDQALRFVLSIRQQLSEIQIQIVKQSTLQRLREEKQIFTNIFKQLQKLKGFEKLFQKVQTQTGGYIPILCDILSKYRAKLRKDNSLFEIIVQILKLIYQILVIIVFQNRKNQQISYNYTSFYADDIFLGLGAENILIQTFKENYKILCRASKPLVNYNNKNIIRATLEIAERFSKEKNNQYWKKILKIIQFLFVLIFDGQSSIDINQRIISQLFFGREMFTKIFLGIKIINHRIKVQHEPNVYVELQRLKNPIIQTLMQEILRLFSMLCYHRNFISKKQIHNFLSIGSKNNIEVMIAYLNMPLSLKLSNSLYSLITNLYIDSAPRIQREKPLSVINFALTASQRSVQEQVQMTDRVKTALLNKLQESYQSRPLQISNLLSSVIKISMQPTLSHEELALYKEQVTQKVRSITCTPDLLRSIKIMIRLQSYTSAQIIQIFKIMKEKLQQRELQPDIVMGVMQILVQISIFTRQVELRKMTAYLKYKYRIKEMTISYSKQYEYLLPFEKKITPSIHYPKDINQSIANYNNQVDILTQIWPKENLNKLLLSILISQSTPKKGHNNLDYIEEIYNCFLAEVFHKKLFLQFIMNSIVVTEEQINTFDSLFDLYKKLKHLTAISQYWLGSVGENRENLKHYIKYMLEVTNFLHQGYEGNSDYSAKEIKLQNSYTGFIVRQDEIYVNRQLLLRNIGFHKLALEILQSNYFLLEIESEQIEKRSGDTLKAVQVFTICFQFIYGFIYDCRETKDLIHKAWNILDKFQNLPEVGQTRVYRELYKNNLEYIREIKKSFIEKIVIKILKNPKAKSNDICQFNPEYLRYLESIVKINGKCHKANLQKFYRLIERDNIFKKMFYCQQLSDGKIQLCLDMFQIKTDIIKVPFIYHIKILGLINDMVESLDSQSTIIKAKLRNIFSLNYLFRILAGPDIYTHQGLQAQMRFLVKKEVIKIVFFLIERNDSINLLMQNEELMNLLNFYYKVFVARVKKIKEQSLNEALYTPYILEYKQVIQYYQHNEAKYFRQQIVPFLQQISSILVKAKKTQNNPIYRKIRQIVDQADDKKMGQFFEYRKVGKNIDKVNLRWLNFVDRDQNNSPQQKFAKLSIVDLLRHPSTQKVLDTEEKQFYKLLGTQTTQFVDILIRLISMNMDEQSKQNQIQQNYTKIYSMLITLANTLKALNEKNKKAQLIVLIMEREIIENFITFCIKLEFDFSKAIVRKIYNYIIKIFVFILQNSEDKKTQKQLYRVLNENPLCYRFWEHLSEAILTISTDVHITNPLDQVNWSLNNIYLIGEEKNQNIYESALRFIQLLCQYSLFTKFLRFQPLYPSKDFIEILYHALNYVLMKQDKKLIFTVPTVEATQKIVNCLSALMIGGNQMNQNFIIDSKYPEIITQLLKIESIKREINKADFAQRERIINEVIQFYAQNGIDLNDNLRRKMAILDFNHPYILNRLKYTLIKTLMQSIAGNERALNKLKFQVPIQLLKINLIWVYEEYVNCKIQYADETILKKLHDWEEVVEIKDLNGNFLMVGFYLYYLIENFGVTAEDKNEQEQNAAQDKEKKKQKLVNKFFNTLSDKDKQKKNLQKLEKEPMGEQMKKYYESYYESLYFFKSKTLTIQVSFNDQLTRVYFPKLPVCNKMTNAYIDEFKEKAVRISQQQKIKSLLEFEEEAYDKFHGEEKFIRKFQGIPIVQKWINIVTEDRLRLAALISCLIQTILFLVNDYQYQSFSFTDSILLTPGSTINTFMEILGFINLFLSGDILFFTIFKKRPIMVQVLQQKQKLREQKEREKFFNGPKAYIIKELFPQFMTTLIYITFLIMSFIHPFFGSFILFDIMNRLELGRQLLRSVKETWFQLLMTTILLILFNYLFAFFIYIQFADDYGPACENLYVCLILLVDQSLKSGSGFYGVVDANFIGETFNLGFFSEIIYIIFAQKVMLEIFSGTIIDKFSQLREQADAVEQDQKTVCFICGQERFTIDFELQGFEQHVKQTHNPINYIFYLFYLRKQNPKYYSIVDKYVNDCQYKNKKHWIPNQTSILKQQKQKQKVVQKQQNQQQIMRQYIDKKIKDIKQIRMKNAMIMSQLKIDHVKNNK